MRNAAGLLAALSLPSVSAAWAAAGAAEGPAAAAELRSIDMPILIYHHTKPGPTPFSAMGQIMTVNPETFEQELQYLKDNGYRTTSFAALAAYLERGTALPERPAIISFDDSWANQFVYAFPLLRKYGFGATFFVVADYLDHENFLTFDQLKEMLAAGMEIGSHSRTHPALTRIGAQRQWSEISGSKAILEDRLGVAIDAFAYPYGSYNREVVALTRAAGYRAARTIDAGSRHAAADLETLAALTYGGFIGRNRLALAAGPTRR